MYTTKISPNNAKTKKLAPYLDNILPNDSQLPGVQQLLTCLIYNMVLKQDEHCKRVLRDQDEVRI